MVQLLSDNLCLIYQILVNSSKNNSENYLIKLRSTLNSQLILAEAKVLSMNSILHLWTHLDLSQRPASFSMSTARVPFHISMQSIKILTWQGNLLINCNLRERAAET